MNVMGMTLRFDEHETVALRARARSQSRSTQDVARQAVLEYLGRIGRRELLDRVVDAELPRYAEALDGLGRRTHPR